MSEVVIALDVMGGDGAPETVLRGADIARRRFPSVHFLLYGVDAVILERLRRMPGLARASTVCHSQSVIGSDLKPSVALRSGRNSSMWLAVESVAIGKASAVVSAGNTGALMAISKLLLRMVPGITRPAIASVMPTVRGESFILDLGANLECDTNNLIQFAVMGYAFSRTALGLVAPTIGILNVGSEDQKGHEELRAAALALRNSELASNFYGFVEGNDIVSGTVDVVVTDGFTGNVALKTIEGTVKLMAHFLSQSFRHSFLARLSYPLVKPAITKFRSRADPRRYNGAIFLGLNGIAVKSHGGTDAFGFATAISTAVDTVSYGFMDKVRDELALMKEALMITSPSSGGCDNAVLPQDKG